MCTPKLNYLLSPHPSTVLNNVDPRNQFIKGTESDPHEMSSVYDAYVTTRDEKKAGADADEGRFKAKLAAKEKEATEAAAAAATAAAAAELARSAAQAAKSAEAAAAASQATAASKKVGSKEAAPPATPPATAEPAAASTKASSKAVEAAPKSSTATAKKSPAGRCVLMIDCDDWYFSFSLREACQQVT